MKVYKGTDKDMKCRGKQYEIGVEATEERAELCEIGIHACEYPLDVFCYYPPCNGSRYFVGDLEGIAETRGPDKVVGTKLKLNAEVGILGLVKAAVEYVKERVDWENAKESNTGICSAATNTGDYSAATNTGDYSAATNTGNRSAATNTGICSAATNTGYRSAATNTGYRSAATNTGNYSAATNTGDYSAATNTGDYSAVAQPRTPATIAQPRTPATIAQPRTPATIAQRRSQERKALQSLLVSKDAQKVRLAAGLCLRNGRLTRSLASGAESP